MPNVTKFEITIEIGTVSLGKYTFPKIPAFAVNVSEVLFKQEEK